MNRAYDCYNRDGKYIGIYYEDSVEELLNKYSNVYYIAGERAIQSGKHWYEFSVSDLEQIRSFESEESIEAYNVIATEVDISNEIDDNDKYDDNVNIDDAIHILDEVERIQEFDTEGNIESITEAEEFDEFIEPFQELSPAMKNLIGDKPVNVITLVSEIENLLEEIRFLRSQLGYPDIPD